jgi:CyaY protein
MTAVNAGEFNQKVDDMFGAIEDALDECDVELDWDSVGGVLSIECENGSQVIINRQEPTRQIWVAARSGGYHFDYDDTNDCWKQDQLELTTLLNQALSEQAGESVNLNLS